MRYLPVLALLAACATSEPQWNICADEKAHVGYRLKTEKGQIGKVVEVFGRSPTCSEPGHPLLVRVEYE